VDVRDIRESAARGDDRQGGTRASAEEEQARIALRGLLPPLSVGAAGSAERIRQTPGRPANANPAPDFKYFSKRKAVRSLRNSIVTSMPQGFHGAVDWFCPALCALNRVETSAVTPMYRRGGWFVLRVM
jgi:hypothetical protein